MAALPRPAVLADIVLTCGLLGVLVAFWGAGESAAAVLGRTTLAVCIAISVIHMLPSSWYHIPIHVDAGSVSAGTVGNFKKILLGVRLFGLGLVGLLCFGVAAAAIVAMVQNDAEAFVLCAFGTLAACRLVYMYVRLTADALRDARQPC